MDKITGTLTVFFEAPFWVGVFERMEEGRLSVAKVAFGAEPRDGEVYAFILRHYDALVFSPAAIRRIPKAAPRAGLKSARGVVLL